MTVHGYDVTVLIDLCKAVIKAESEGKLLARQQHIARQAHVILGASAKAGITDLVYRLSGYERTREEAIAAFKFYIREEARDYQREFPNQLYQEWYRLYQLPVPERNKPWKFKHLTVIKSGGRSPIAGARFFSSQNYSEHRAPSDARGCINSSLTLE